MSAQRMRRLLMPLALAATLVGAAPAAAAGVGLNVPSVRVGPIAVTGSAGLRVDAAPNRVSAAVDADLTATTPVASVGVKAALPSVGVTSPVPVLPQLTDTDVTVTVPPISVAPSAPALPSTPAAPSAPAVPSAPPTETPLPPKPSTGRSTSAPTAAAPSAPDAAPRSTPAPTGSGGSRPAASAPAGAPPRTASPRATDRPGARPSSPTSPRRSGRPSPDDSGGATPAAASETGPRPGPDRSASATGIPTAPAAGVGAQEPRSGARLLPALASAGRSPWLLVALLVAGSAYVVGRRIVGPGAGLAASGQGRSDDEVIEL